MRNALIALLLYLFALPALAEKTILVLGDSLSAAHGISIKDSWVALLEKRLKQSQYPYRVVNVSVSGATTSNGLALLPKALRKYHPHITIIELGGNDGLRGLQIANIKNNLQSMIRLVKKSHSKVLLLGIRIPPNYGPDYTQQLQRIYTDLAQQEMIKTAPLFLKNVDTQPNLLQKDGIHPTAAAQNTLLENVWPNLELLLEK